MLYNTTLLEKLAAINWGIVGVMSAIATIGFAMMYSAGGGDFSVWAMPQIIRFLLAFSIMLLLAILPMRVLMDYAYIFYFGCVIVLVGVDIIGHTGMGAQRWLKLGGLNLQPSEFMKLALILAVARYLHHLHPEDIRRFSYLVPLVLMIAVPAVLILRQPNLGTTTILAGVGVIMAFLAGVPWRYFIGVAISGLACLPVIWQFMHDYQKRRVLTFLDPSQDPLGAGYNILQSMIAIGSGGFLGKGFTQGSQSQLNFLPEKHTDFIFTMLGEEFGFLGCMLLLGLYGLLLAAGMSVAATSRSSFGAMVAAGVTSLLFLHILINCAMVMGLLPVVGVPLPLMSYGGSIMVSTVLAMGLLLNVCAHRDEKTMRHTPNL
jgi:rod shape determining protein RodA